MEGWSVRWWEGGGVGGLKKGEVKGWSGQSRSWGKNLANL